jgi:subtilisin-like proprotein convertase family protein
MSRHLRLLITLVLALVTALALAAGPAVAKKKKGKGKAVKTLAITNPAPVAIPDRPVAPPDPYGQASSVITVGKKFKKTEIRDVNVTVQLTGSDATAMQTVLAQITAPNGASTFLFFQLTGQTAGPLTLDDESPRFIVSGSFPTGCPSPLALCEPFSGSARPGIQGLGTGLSVLDGGPARGAWTLNLLDSGSGGTTTLNSWGITVRAGKPFKTED